MFNLLYAFRTIKDEIGEDWTTVSGETEAAPVFVNVDKSKLPLIKNENDQEVSKLFKCLNCSSLG